LDDYFKDLSSYKRKSFFSEDTIFKTALWGIDFGSNTCTRQDSDYFYGDDDDGNEVKLAYKTVSYRIARARVANILVDDETLASVHASVDDEDLTEDNFKYAGAKAIQYAAGLIKKFYDATHNTPGDPITVLTHSLIWIPAGSFMMGSEDNEYGWAQYTTPVHEVSLSGFYIGAYEVTQAQYEAVMGTNPSKFQGTGYPDSVNMPVEEVTWYEAREFCEKLSEQTSWTFTLPSEAQWEYACRAGTTTLYSFGDDDDDLGDYAWYYTNSGILTHPVGTKLPNPWGLYDMMGNVLEWCLDSWHNYYTGAPTDGSAWEPETDSSRIVRGGRWESEDPWDFRSANRNARFPTYGDRSIGFRVVAIP
jgi:formylglycine-generating enzyme required for sulfatase activity